MRILQWTAPSIDVLRGSVVRIWFVQPHSESDRGSLYRFP
jgi:hypothetical protein